MEFLRSLAIGAVAAVALAGFSGERASAVSYVNDQIVDDNDCAGALGIPPNCSLNGSKLIVKLNPNGTVSELGLFPSIDGKEFTLVSTGEGTGTWTYNPGPDDPTITGWTTKGSNSFRVQLAAGPNPLSGSYLTPINPNNNKPAGLSHITFFNGSPSPVPLPAAAWLLLSGLGGLGLMGWRKRSVAA